jgi:D-serine deaminase-like pyridoxal phosphate-dependent protein
MDPRYPIRDASSIFTPALLFYPDIIRKNLQRMIHIAGSPNRLRPHAKTHKCREIIRMALDAGITKHKCATLAEADMLGELGVRDVLLAYPMVGPNCGRFARLIQQYPASRFSVLVDHPDGIAALNEALQSAGVTAEVVLDINVGQNRTGVAPDSKAVELYEQIARSPALRPGGLQLYDGHNHQESLAERKQAVEELLVPVRRMLAQFEAKGLPAPRIIAGGTPTFSVWAESDLPNLECSPGTCVLHDHGYGSRFPDLGMEVAAVMLTRVVSRPTANRVTLDLGTKALASDPPAGQRCRILDVADARFVAHNEEHLVFECPDPGRFRIGDLAYVVPTHICPTVALHRQALVVGNNAIVDRWDIIARDRVLRL